MYSISKLFNPEVFQGKYKNKNYFEGWYYKLVDKNEEQSFAFIPGVAYDKQGQGHAFIQIIDSEGYKTEYFRFDIEDFSFSEEDLDVSIGKNRFTQTGIDIDLSDRDYPVEGSLKFTDIVEFPKKKTRPGIMGPFSFVPYMECYHGVVNIDQRLEGSLEINGRKVDFTDGHGYIEKDWGRSFPKWWIWLQSNNFQDKDVSLMFAVAKIPWMGHHFTGFLTFLKTRDDFYLFATYTGAKIRKMDYKNGRIDLLIEDRKHSLSIQGDYDKSGVLKAPKNGLMDRKISESISSRLRVVLKDKKGKVIFDDYGENAGLEVVGKHLVEE